MRKLISYFSLSLSFIAASLAASVLVWAQATLPAEVARHGYADLVVLNGKIVSMDDAGYNTSVGRTYEAMAIKGTRIVALGTSQYIRTLADSNTRVVDAMGQLVIPGIVETHAHLFGNPQLGQQLGVKYPDKGISIRVQAGKDIESTRLRIENSIRDAVKKVQPGDWVLVGVMPNAQEGISSSRVWTWITSDHLETRKRLDGVAPVNPILVQSGPRATLSSAGWEMAEKFLPSFGEFSRNEMGLDFNNGEDPRESGFVSVSQMQGLQWDVWNKDTPVSLIAEMFRRDLEMAAAHGVTTFSSRIPHPKILSGYVWLNHEGQMPVRFAGLYETHRRPNDPAVTRQFYRTTGILTGLGDEYFWIHGVASEKWDALFPTACLGPDVEAPARIKAREVCMRPDDMWWGTLQNALEAGWRLAGIHGVGSHGARLFVQMVEAAMKNSGMTVDDVRKLRLTVEHAEALGKVPDVVASFKKYGITVSAGARFLLVAPEYVNDYGPKVEPFLLPVKSLLDQGIKVVGQNEGYRNLGYMMTLMMTRRVAGKQYAPEEAVDRVTVLKMWTKWASEYVMKEKDLGSLEVGKLADFVILDKDFLTVPVDQIPSIKPQITVMGGKIRYLGKDFAAKLGSEPVGWQYPAGFEPWGEPDARGTGTIVD